jgi:hypothetical protein
MKQKSFRHENPIIFLQILPQFLVEVQIIYILYLSGQDTFFYKNLATEIVLLYRGKDK